MPKIRKFSPSVVNPANVKCSLSGTDVANESLELGLSLNYLKKVYEFQQHTCLEVLDYVDCIQKFICLIGFVLLLGPFLLLLVTTLKRWVIFFTFQGPGLFPINEPVISKSLVHL